MPSYASSPQWPAASWSDQAGPSVQIGQQQTLPTQFLVEVISADGQIRRAGTPLDDADGPQRTPLTSVLGLAEFGLQQGNAASPDELLRLITLIQHEASRMRRLADDLLMLARLDTGRP